MSTRVGAGVHARLPGEWTPEATRSNGTGSYPPCTNGWQRSSRQTVIAEPRSAPCRSTASAAYSEQVGT